MRPARRAVRSLPRRRQRPPARPRRRRRPPRPRQLGRRAPRVRAAARVPASTPRSARTSAPRSTRRRATSSTSRARRRAYETLHHAGVLDASHRPVDHPPRRVLARHCCRRAYLRGALLGAGSLSGPRDPHLEIRTAEIEGARFLADVAEREGAQLHVLDRGRHAVAYAKGTETIADVLVAAGAVDVVLALEERSVVAATRADANRLANADHANLVRTSRAAHAQLEAVRRLEADGAARRALAGAAGDGRAPAPPPDALDRRARPPLQAARDEGLRVPAAAPPPGARGALTPAIRLAKRLAHFVTTESYSPRRVRARPAADSDPVRRHGLGCGCTGGEGRPRSFPSGPAFASGKPVQHAELCRFCPGGAPLDSGW